MSIFCCAFLRLCSALGHIWCWSDSRLLCLVGSPLTAEGEGTFPLKIFGMEIHKYLITFLGNKSSQDNEYKSKSKALAHYQNRSKSFIILTEQITCKWVIHNCFIKIVNKCCLILYLIKYLYNFSQKNLSCEHEVAAIRLSKNSTLWKVWVPQPKMCLGDAVHF